MPKFARAAICSAEAVTIVRVGRRDHGTGVALAAASLCLALSLSFAASAGVDNVPDAAPLVTVFAGSTADAKRTATLELNGGGSNCGLESASFDAPAVEPPAGVVFPDGLIDFVASHCARGSTLRFTLIMSTVLPPGANFWKYGPTAADRSPHWYPMAAIVAGSSVAYRIVDGGAGDDDLKANGTVTGRGGIGIGTVAAPTVPEGLAALPGNGSVALRWNAVNGAVAYTVKRATAKEGPYVGVSIRQPGNVFTDNGRTNGATYFYAVSAANGGGDSADSMPVQATPIAAKKVTACGVEPMTFPRSIACPPEMTGTIIEEEVYACNGTRWQSTGWRVKESACTVLDLGGAPPTTF